MSIGLLLMGGGYIWLGMLTNAGVSYTSRSAPFIVAGIGISMAFPTMANASIAAVSLNGSGVTSGSNNTLREVGGLFGIAALAAVFTDNGSFATQADFMPGVKFTIRMAAAVGPAVPTPALPGPSRARMPAGAAETEQVPGAAPVPTAVAD